MSFTIEDHKASKRVRVIKFKEADLDRLIFPFKKHTILSLEYKVEHPVFSKDKNGKPTISYIDQFPEPKNMKKGLLLQKLSDALEQSKNKISFPLPVGSTIFSNNYFWLHGRKAFKEHSGLSRELLRIRGTFFH